MLFWTEFFKTHSSQWNCFMWSDTRNKKETILHERCLTMCTQTCNSLYVQTSLVEILLAEDPPLLVHLWNPQLLYWWLDFHHEKIWDLFRYLNQVQLSENLSSSVTQPCPISVMTVLSHYIIQDTLSVILHCIKVFCTDFFLYNYQNCKKEKELWKYVLHFKCTISK
jgi:hypothetical protein